MKFLSLVVFGFISAAPLFAEPAAPKACLCKDCRCTADSHCGCHSEQGCACSK